MKLLKDYLYYKTDLGTLYLGDCLEILPLIDKVDLVLTDPPYGKQWARGKNGIGELKNKNEKLKNVEWDKQIPKKEIFDLMLQISNNQIIFGGNYFTDYLYPSNCWIVWDKLGDLKLGKQIPFAHCELVWTSFNNVIKKITFKQQGFIKSTKDKRQHPTQKPSELFYKILKDYSKENDLILDPFSGSGTTGVVCEKLNRKYILIEILEKYCVIAKQRIKNEYNKLKLNM